MKHGPTLSEDEHLPDPDHAPAHPDFEKPPAGAKGETVFRGLAASKPQFGGAGIGDIVSDFLYREEELRIEAPARPITAVVAGIGDRYLALVDVDEAIRVWDFETGAQITVEGHRPRESRAIFPNRHGANLIVVQPDGRVDETAGMSFATKATLLPAGSAGRSRNGCVA
jgi:hypothetical protein